MSFLLKWDFSKLEIELLIEDDGRAAYAYMMREMKCASLVWLYNTCPDDDLSEDTFLIRGEPCINGKKYLYENQIRPLTPETDLYAECVRNDDGCVQIEIRILPEKTLLAILVEGEKCGWSSNSKISSKVARSFEDNCPCSEDLK